MKILKHKRAPKTYKEPKGLGLDATGLLAHMRDNLSSDGTYRWGVKATAEYFGISRNRIAAAYSELEDKKEVTDIYMPPLPSGRQPIRVVKTRSCSQISTGETRVNTGDTGDSSPRNEAVLTEKHGSVAVERRSLKRQLKAVDESLRIHRVRAEHDASLLSVIKTEEAEVAELKAKLEGAQ